MTTNGESASNHERNSFQQALARIADGSLTATEWNEFAQQRFAQPELEQVRRELVRIALLTGQCSARPVSAALQARAGEVREAWLS